MTGRRDMLKKMMMATLAPSWIGIDEFSGSSRSRLLGKETKRPIYLFSKVLQWENVMDVPDIAREMGFDGVDLTVRPGGHISPHEVKTVLPKFFQKCLDVGLQAPMLSTSILDAKKLETQEILKTASSLGVKNYRMGWYEYDFSKELGPQLAIMKGFVKELAVLNEELGINGNYQNHAGKGVGAALWDAHQLVESSNSYTGLEYDIRHAMVEGAFSWPVTFQLVKEKIQVIDIKDFAWKCEAKVLEPVNVPLGEGVVDFKGFFELLNKMGIYTPLSIHVEHDLGGAEKGDKSPKIAKNLIIEAIKKDLEFLKLVA